MASHDSLVQFRDAALRCNEAAKVGAAWVRNRGNESPETTRHAIPAWIAEIDKACLGWSILALSAEKLLDAIKQAAAAHSLPPIQIRSDSYQTAHEAANARATFVKWCLRGDLEELPDGIATDLVGRIEQEYLQAKAAVEEQDADQEGESDPNFRHSDDFRSVVWSGTSYTFSKAQAACVKVLWAARKAGTPELDGLTVVTQADVSQTRLIDVFRSKGKAHAAWGTMIIQGHSKGANRLNDKPAVAPPKAPRKGSRKTTRKTHR